MAKLNIRKTIYIAAYVLVVIYAVSFAFFDSYDMIVKWALKFTELLSQGQILHYYEIVKADYNIFIIIIFAIWMLPFDLVMKLLHLSAIPYSLLIYTIWYKGILIIALVVSIHYLDKLLSKLDFSEDDKWLAKLLYIVSPITLMGNVAWGQIDIIPTMLVIIALCACLDKKYIRMCILFSIAAAFKYHALLLVIPMLLLLEKRIVHLVKYIVICGIGPVTVELLSRLDPYYVIAKADNDIHLGGIFLAFFNHQGIYVSCFLLLCIACYRIVLKDEDTYMLIASPAVSFFLFMFFVNWHVQWGMYIMPFLLIILLKLKDRFFSLLLNLGISFGVFCYQVVLWDHWGDNYMTDHGIFRLLLNRPLDYEYAGIPLGRFLGMQTWLGQTIIMPCLIFAIGTYIYENYKNKSTAISGEIPHLEEKYALSAFLPSVIFAFASIAMYILNI